MRRFTLAFSILALGLSAAAFGQTIDPVGFCPPPATTATCTTANGLGGETIGVGATDIGMMKNGNGGTAADPWYLLVAMPDYTGPAPTITFNGGAFTQTGTATNVGDFLPTTSGSLYTFAGVTGDGSMNAANLFCDGATYPCTTSNEISAFGSLPTFFDVFKYAFTPAIQNNVAYELTASGLIAGTYLAAAGGTNPFTTPFTTTGLVNGPGCTPDTCGGGPGGNPVPEPSSVLLLLTVCGAIFLGVRKRVRAVS